MGVSGNSIAGKSFQSFAISEELLAKVTEAVQAGEKQARSSGNIQSFEVFYRGFRQNIAIGRIFVIPASVCSDRKDFPTALLYGCLVKEFGGEEIGDMIEKKIGESEFDEYSQADFDTIKEKLFGVGGGKFESLVLFAPTWLNKREYITFKFTKDEAKLKNNLRHQVFSAYYDPRLSSAFNAIMTNVNTTKVDVTDITPKLNFPFLAENLLTQFPTLEKQASNRKKIFLTRHTAEAVTQEILDPQELDVFESLDQALSEALMPGTETVAEAAEPDSGGFNTPDSQNEVPRVAGKKNKASIEPAAHEAPFTNVGPGTAAADAQESMVKAVKEHVEKKEGEAPIGIAIDENGVPRSKAEEQKIAKWAKVAGKEIKTARVKMTFGTNNVYFDMDGKKYMLDGIDAEEFLNEWLPIFNELKTKANVERDRVVEELAQKYMSRMQKRTNNITKAPAPTKITMAPEVSEKPEAMAQHASKKAQSGDDYGPTCPKCNEAIMHKTYVCPKCGHKTGASKEASADAFTPVNKKDKIHPGNLKDADVIAAIDEKKWGNATIPINFGKREAGIPTIKNASKPDYRTPVREMDAFTRQYLVTALWSENDESDESGGEPLENNYGVGDFSPKALEEAIGVCRNFQHDNAQLLEQAYQRPGYNEGRAGHDFWLTRNGHGAGYWDRDELKGGLGDQLTQASDKFGEADVYVGDDNTLYFNESASASPQHDIEFKASYVASKMSKLVDYEAYDAASPKAKKARDAQEAKLAKNRQKQADVPMDIDSIWAEITEEMGPAPVVDIPGDGGSGSGGAAADSGESKSEGSGDGRPRKSDIGKRPEEMTSDEPEEETSDSEPEEDSEPEQKSESKEDNEEKWHVSSSMEDFVKEAFDEMEDEGGPRVSCDQCQMLSINGTATHEIGCPNSKKHWDAETGEWVRYVKCFECGDDVLEDDAQQHAEEHQQDYFDPEMEEEEEELEPEPEDMNERHVSSKVWESKEKIKEKKGSVAPAGIPAKVRNHNEHSGFGQLSKGLVNQRATLVSIPHPGYAEVQFADGTKKTVPTFALLTTKNGWKFIREQADKLDQEHVKQCGKDDCIRCGHIPGTPARAKAEEHIRQDRAMRGKTYNASATADKTAISKKQRALDEQVIQDLQKNPINVKRSDVEKHRSDWAQVAKERNWGTNPIYVQCWVIRDGTITDSVSHKGLKKDIFVYEGPEFDDGDGFGGRTDHVIPVEIVEDAPKTGSVESDVAEAKSEVVSPDTVDSTIQQETKSVEEAAHMAADEGNKKTFNSIEERNAYIEENFPQRECEDTPGLYKVPGGYLGVRLEEVTFYPSKTSSKACPHCYQANGKHEAWCRTNAQKKDKSAVVEMPTKGTPEIFLTKKEKGLDNQKVTPRKRGPQLMDKDKQSNDVSSDMSEAKSELDHGAKSELADNADATKTVNPEHFAAAPGNPMEGEPGDALPEACPNCHVKQGDQCQCPTKVSTMLIDAEQMDQADQGIKCPHCHSDDTDEVDAKEGQHVYCHNCEQVSKVGAKNAAAGDDMPEEVSFDFGAGDLADIVIAEEDTDGATE